MNHIKNYYLLHRNGILIGLEIFLVCFFGFIEWQLNNRFYSFFIIGLFLITLVLKRRNYFVLIIVTTLVFIGFNTLAFDNLVSIKNVDLPAVQHPKQFLNNLFTPNSGQGVYPATVQSMVFLLDLNNIDSYQISSDLKDDVEIYQRIVGAAWPKKMDDTSPFILIGADEIQNFPDCMLVEQKEDVILVDCH